jgi:hypothetical protein
MSPVAVPPVADAPLHVETGHMLTESMLGVAIGTGLVVGYLLVLRLLGGRDDGRVRERHDKPGSEG